MYSPLSDLFLPAIRYPHTQVTRVDVWRNGSNVTPTNYVRDGIPIVDGGTVTVDANSQIRRSVSLTVADPALSPAVAQDLLAPYGTELRIRKGLEYPDGTVELVPLGWFRVDAPQTEHSGETGPTGISITGSDRFGGAVDGRFFNVTPSVGSTVVAEIRHLLDPVMPSYVPAMIDLTGDTTPCPAQVYSDQDRMGAITKNATAINAECFMNADGVPVLRPEPRALSARNVWTIDSNTEDAVLLDEQTAADRSVIYNAVIVHGKQLDGHPTSWAEVLDNDPASPTRYGGPFGKKPTFFSSPILTSNAACAAAGATMLGRYTGAGWTISLTSLVNPALDAGDVIRVVLPDGRTQYHIIDTLSIPLDGNSPMTVTTRTNTPDGDVDESA